MSRFNKLVFGFYGDMSKCFDRINRELLFREMGRFGFDADSVMTLDAMYKKTRLRTKTNGNQSKNKVQTTVGLPQGDFPSSTGWNCVYDHMIIEMNISDYLYHIEGEYFSIIVFADDTFFVANDPIKLQLTIDFYKVLLDHIDMFANVLKSVIMIFGRSKYKQTIIDYMVFKWGELEIVIKEQYKWLGILMSDKLLLKSAWDAQIDRVCQKTS